MSNKLIGTGPNQVPSNADLGTMAYQDSKSLNVSDVKSETLEIKPEVNKQGYALVVKTNHANNPIAMSISDASLLNGIAFSQQAFTPLCVGRDSGSTFSAYFNGRVAIAAGYGINFGAADPTNSLATITSNTMEEYEEGSWTPVISVENAGPASITVNHATYTKVGRLVSLVFDVTINSVTGTNSSRAIQLTGMPFTINTAYGGGPNIAYSNLTNSMTGSLALQGRLNTRYRIVNLNSGTGQNASDHLQANTVLRGQFTYHAD